MATFLNDTFTDTDGTALTAHTGEVGATWTRQTGSDNPTVAINSNKVSSVGFSQSALYHASGTPANANYSVSAVFDDPGSSAFYGPGARMVSGQSTGYFAVYFNTVLRIYKRVNGTLTGIGNTVLFTPSAGVVYTITITVQGPYISAQLQRASDSFYLGRDGTFQAAQVAPVTAYDTTITAAGLAGFWIDTATGLSSISAADVSAFPAAPTAAVPLTNPNVFFSPYNWWSDGTGAMASNNIFGSSTYALTNNCGAYIKTKLVVPAGGGTCYVAVGTDHNGGYSSSANWPTLQYSVDGAAPTSALLSSGQTQISLGSLTAGTHDVFVWFKSIGQYNIDRWGGALPANAVRIYGFDGPVGLTSAAPRLFSKRAIAYGDSITEGLNALSTASNNSGQQSGYTWIHMLAVALGAEVGVIGFGSQGDVLGGIGGVPAANVTYGLYMDNRSRLVSGALSPEPDYLISNLGENGVNTSAYTALLAAMRTTAPNAKLFALTPFNGNDPLTGVTLPSGASYVIDITGAAKTGGQFDQITGFGSPNHPDLQGSAAIAARLVEKITPFITSGASTGASFGTFGSGRL